ELDAAIEHLVEVRKTQLEQGWCDAAVPPHRARDLIEALVRAGRAADAEREVSIFEQETHQTERPSALAALACCRGLLAPGSFATPWPMEATSSAPSSTPERSLPTAVGSARSAEPPRPWNT